jgi:hypothetical protein
MAGLRVFRNETNACPQLSNHIAGDLEPSSLKKVALDRLEVAFSLWREDERLHSRAERSSSSRCASIRSKTVSPSTPSPRRSDSKPSSISFAISSRWRTSIWSLSSKKAESFTNYFVGRAVTAGLDLALNKILKLGSQVNAHRFSALHLKATGVVRLRQGLNRPGRIGGAVRAVRC